MESQHSTSLSLMSDQFRIAIILTFIVHVPFQRFENTSISDDVLCTKDFSGFLFRISAAAILYWSKYCCWNVFVTHQSCLVVEKSCCQQTTGHDGCWGKLQSAMTDISDSVNVINWGFVIFWSKDFSVFSDLDSNFFKPDRFCLSASADSKKNGIKNVLNFVFALLECDNFSACGIQLNLDGYSFFDKLNSRFFHIVPNLVSNLLIKPSQENRPNHNRHMTP